MPAHHFISYSTADAQEQAFRLYDALLNGVPAHTPWLDKKCLRSGDYDVQLRNAIRSATTLLFLASHDSVADSSGTKPEWYEAMRSKKPIIPLILTPGLEMPFLFGTRQQIDLSASFDAGVAQLREHLGWLQTTAGILYLTEIRLADADRELRRANTPEETDRWNREVVALRAEILRLREILDDPARAAARTDQRVGHDIERERQPITPSSRTRSRIINAPPYRVRHDLFRDRTEETRSVTRLLRNDGVRLIAVVGRGGAGKTALVCRLLELLEQGKDADGEPFDEMIGIVYLSGVGTQHLIVDKLYRDIAQLLPEPVANELLALYRTPQVSMRDRMASLLEKFTNGRLVLLIDNFEDLVDSSENIANSDLLEQLRALLELPHHAVKTIITTRVMPTDLARIQVTRQKPLNLGDGLPSPFAEEFLRDLDSDGTAGLRSATQEQLFQAQRRTRGFPKALEALYQVLAEDPTSSLQEILDTSATYLPDRVIEDFVGDAFSRLDPASAQVVQTLAIFEQPVPPVAIDFVLRTFVPSIDSAPVLGRLLKRHFARRDDRGRYFLHPVERQYALSQVPVGARADRRLGHPPFTQFALRSLAADYFAEASKPRENWRSIEDLEPQLAEIELRCIAEEFDQAGAVVQVIHYDYLYAWGCYRQMVDLHERLQDHLSDPGLRENILRHLGIAYAGMGRVREAIRVTEASLELSRSLKLNSGETLNLGNLGTYFCDIGDVRRALKYYESADKANRWSNTYLRCVNRIYQGECRALLGESDLSSQLLAEGLNLASQDRRGQEREGLARALLAQVWVDLNQIDDALFEAERAVRIGTDLRAPRITHAAAVARWRAHMSRAFFAEARQAATDALDCDLPIQNHLSQVLMGIVQARLGHSAAARESFVQAITAAENAIAFNEHMFGAFDSVGVSLASLRLLNGEENIADAVAAHTKARTINADAGVRSRVAELYDLLAPLDTALVLHTVRAAAVCPIGFRSTHQEY